MGEGIEIGSSIGHYRIVSKIGAGGMGEVYLAHDARLDRNVAVKMLPADFANDEDRLRRFEQEAKATSALNHPNILTVYDIGEHDGSPFIVAELLDGMELRERLDEGSIPLRKVTDYAQQIVSGLSAAHEKGIVHRDLKPENLFITKDDRVKILDFGLAKLSEPGATATGSEDHTRKALTNPGVVMGTVGYMSPEQVRGQMTDHRSDIFSFGLILYEMITGRRAFQEESLAETMSAIVKEEPPEMTESNPNISPSLERIVRRCLEKKPERRFHSAHDLGFALESLSAPTSSSGANMTTTVSAIGLETERSTWSSRIPWMVAAAAVLIALVIPTVMYIRRPSPDERPVSFIVAPPASSANLGSPVISPDGRTLAFAAIVDGKSNIYVRELGSLTEQSLNGTEDASSSMFWAPDSRTIAFFANGKLKKVDIAGGPAQVICNAPDAVAGTWNRDGVILVGSSNRGIRRVSAAGGELTELLPLDESRKEIRHMFPRFLPDGRHFLYRSNSSSPSDPPEIFVASIDGKERKPLFKNYSDFYYAAPGYLLFSRDTTVMAQPFDASRLELTGDPVPVLENVNFTTFAGRSFFSVSENGTIVCLSGSSSGNRQLTWYDREGKEISKVGQPGNYMDLVLSPDGKQAAASRIVDGNADIWVIDLERGLPTRFTFNAAADDDPAWSADGGSILFTSNRDNDIRKLYRKLASGAGNEELISDTVRVHNTGIDWSPDGKNILFASRGEKTGFDIWVLPLGGDAKPYPLLQSEFTEEHVRFSPDGRFFAYKSNESGQEEVYVQNFPPAGGKWQVSTGGGSQPHWRRDGQELYYVAPDRKLMVVSVKPGESFQNGTPAVLFQTEVSSFANSNRYAVTADGQRFLVNSPVDANTLNPYTVILNWTSTLKK